MPVGKHPNMALFTPDGKRAYVSNSGDASLSILDIQTLKVAETINGVGRDVSSMAVSPDGGKLIIIATGEDKYLIIDTAAHRTIAEGSTGQDPRSLALTPDGGQVLIANRVSNSLTVVDIRTGRVIGTIAEVGDKPSSVAVSSDGRRAFIVLIGARAQGDPPQRLSGKDAALTVIDLATGRKIAAVKLGGDPYAVAIRD
jgi:YVTN family beta-propeller protein